MLSLNQIRPKPQAKIVAGASNLGVRRNVIERGEDRFGVVVCLIRSPLPSRVGEDVLEVGFCERGENNIPFTGRHRDLAGGLPRTFVARSV